MSVTLNEQEIKELKSRFNSFVLDESVQGEQIVHTLSTGRIVYGSVNSEGVLQIKSVTNYLRG